jgi:hypothetical protein
MISGTIELTEGHLQKEKLQKKIAGQVEDIKNSVNIEVIQ